LILPLKKGKQKFPLPIIIHRASPFKPLFQAQNVRLLFGDTIFKVCYCCEKLKVSQHLQHCVLWWQDPREATGKKGTGFKNWELGKIQNGNWDTDTDSMSSMSQGPCWDAGASLGRGKAPGRVETLPPWTPSPWKASPCHDTLRE
jgi:hypothetical protein